MKYVFALLLLMIPASSHAATPVTGEMAAKYNQTCKVNRDMRMHEDTQNILCDCTAMKMQGAMSVEDMQAMGGNDQNARVAINKMLTTVYAPCMEFPVRDLIYGRCKQDAYQAGKGICECLSSQMARYTAQQSQRLLGDVLRNNPNVADPMDAILSSAEFKQMEKRIVLQCIQQPNGR